MKNSFKQLFRTPAKTLLFFLLMTAVTLLLVFSASLLSETTQRIDEVENSFTTLARVEQVPAMADVPATWYNECWGPMSGTENVYDEMVIPDTLNLDGLNYVNSPEYRPYYLAREPEWTHTLDFYNSPHEHIIEFTALEDSGELGEANVRVERVLIQGRAVGYYESVPTEGMELFLCQCGGTFSLASSMIPLEKGKRYIACIFCYWGCRIHSRYDDPDFAEYIVSNAPYSTQRTPDGELIQGDYFPHKEDGTQIRSRVEEVTEGFWEEGGRGQDWLNWVDFLTQDQHLFAVMPTTNLQMLPVFQEHRAYVSQGREITSDEYDSGALVCMVPENTMQVNGWKLGDKIRLPLTYSLYGQNASLFYGKFFYTFSPLKADGSTYDVFWDAEYEIVGTYNLTDLGDLYSKGEIYADTILIPKNSVQASDADNIAGYNYMDGKTATFQIENGTIDDFDAALRAAVPEAESLLITYNDNGYTEIMESLQSTRTAALLLFVVGLLAAVVIVLLLLYFFIVRERKRTAIERSLGMSKRACRVSLLTGILALTVLAAGLGTAGGAAAMALAHGQDQPAVTETVEADAESPETTDAALLAEPDEDSEEPYNPKYSLWAKADQSRQQLSGDYRAPAYLYALIPAALVLGVLLLSLWMVERNLRVKPIYLLSTKGE